MFYLIVLGQKKKAKKQEKPNDLPQVTDTLITYGQGNIKYTPPRVTYGYGA